ncbi:coiled-coil domain-containing protein 15-like [Mizuhopecten yessoensis]|uniref:Coiled-coil domain-containing protein 15 n=1 Tax=Mizuhopecten yessoensis TaxID=6573 RepID=A0A210QRP4_MIZYE|nr:coiled-coil domain-containing protein 15-like [Mizuhopecten yessoensis]OWF51416.1 Coiled-coil domain-containing protein 15 [Mizuhopecten yessoensis]
MASKTRPASENYLRKISKPVISTDVMGNRNVEIRAVGAWVQPSISVHSEGVTAAQEEDARIKRMQQEKEARLQKFKDDVKHRVRLMERARKQQETEKSYRAVEHERKVVRQSAFSKENTLPRKDNCIVQRNHALTIKQRNTSSSFAEDHRDATNKAFQDQTNQIHKFTSQARKKLSSKQVITEDFIPDDLPGGVWKVSRTRDHPSSRHTMEPTVIELNDEDEEEEDDIWQSQTDQPKIVIPTGSQDVDDNLENMKQMKMVHFDLEPSKDESRKERIARKTITTISGTQINRSVPHVPNIYMGVQSEEEKQRLKSQQATYRRLFMDIEREQVKENLKRKEHRKRIQRLKKEKEEERREEEEKSRRFVEPRDPVTGETSLQTLTREIEEQEQVKETLRRNQLRLKKLREMERFVEALRAQLREKIELKGIQLPPLCCCGISVWDTNPETCANNCVFYKNPRGFAKALQSLLISCDVS